MFESSCDDRFVNSKYTPLPWEGHFDKEKNVAIPDSDHVMILDLKIFPCLHLFKIFSDVNIHITMW